MAKEGRGTIAFEPPENNFRWRVHRMVRNRNLVNNRIAPLKVGYTDDMSFEQQKTQKDAEAEPELQKRIDELELRVHELVGELKGNLDNPAIAELASTAEGQSKLLKIQEHASRFNQRVLGIVAMINAPTFFTMLAQDVGRNTGSAWAESLEPFINSGGHMAVATLFVACGFMSFRLMKRDDQADKVFDTLEHKS